MSACPHVSDPHGTCPSAADSFRRRTSGQIDRTEWQERLAEQVAETMRRRERRRLDQARHAEARTHGLKKRHATKLARKHQETPRDKH